MDSARAAVHMDAKKVKILYRRDRAHMPAREIELDDAIKDAKLNAELNNVSNAEFICGDAKDAIKELQERSITPKVVILDPPRKGCNEELLKTVAEISPERIVYVSCDPATLARDAKRLVDLGYETKKVTPVDMFPRTSHVETVCLLSRKDK